MLTFGSVCSGIEAASVAWQRLGWNPAFFSEIDPFASAVLAHHWPDVPNLGDMTLHEEWPDAALDVLVGGTPCQSFSVAGLRRGLDDPRGNLMLVYLAIAEQYRPQWVVWENVPGVLSSNQGRDFGSLLWALGKLGYGFAYRILDAQYFGVAQRRRRVFVVGYRGDWRRAAAVLFERQSLSGDPAPCREQGKGFAADVAPSLTASGRGVERVGETRGQDPVIVVPTGLSDISHTLTASAGRGVTEDGCGRGTPIMAFTCKDDGRDCTMNISPTLRAMSGTAPNGGGQVAIMAQNVALRGRDGGGTAELGGDVAGTVRASSGGGDKAHILTAQQPPVAFAQNSRDEVRLVGGDGGVVGALAAEPGMKQQSYLYEHPRVRRLMPVECERLQGFPDDFTAIPFQGKPASDSRRYKAIGNSIAVPCMEWIGRRIDLMEKITRDQ